MWQMESVLADVVEKAVKRPTGIGYLLLQVSSPRPDLVICDKAVLEWARVYMGGSRRYNLRLGCHGCGIIDERLAYEVVLAAVSKDMQHEREFNLCGRAGLLHLLRLVRHWVPESARMVNPIIAEVSNALMRPAPGWTWHSRRYLGAVHGDIGILLQLLRISPELEPQMKPDTDWNRKELVQLCHGALEFVVGLLSFCHHFPDLKNRIDAAGLLTKEPNLCHGIFGNAL
ncbi:hypothetical protein B0T18DRAFT_441489 [Schizothecium vesticola]|uniref:Uncharacterized protein n=1 Tax=Schizothecium vesticola TaxID=314040 RepID=A0AA40BRJ6_9PEZI|nr:hypothetical protein B0T18DRAFT_441489 [Schizothecium vesticola]